MPVWTFRAQSATDVGANKFLIMSRGSKRPMQVNDIKLHPLYGVTGMAAIVLGGLLAAGFAKTPNTLAMWSSAYLVLVVGVAQVFIAAVIAQLVPAKFGNLTLWVYGLFNGGSWLVILGTVLKYSGVQWHMATTTLGAALVIGAMSLLVWQLRDAKKSRLRTAAYVVVASLILSSFIGVGLATLR